MKTSLVYGGKCTELLANYDQEFQSWRMLQMSFQWAAPMLLDRLPKSGMTVNGQLYALQTLEHHTKEQGGFVLPTPTASDPIKHGSGGLHRLLCRGERYSKGDHRRKMLPTPTHHANNNPHTPSAWNRDSDPGVQYAKAFGITKEQAIGKGFQVNPPFVEEMMGFPIGWTDVQP